MTAREAAKDLIRKYVLRGDSLQFLHSMGRACPDYWAEVGSGYLNGKKFGTDKIAVSKINGKECEELFSLKELYREILNEQRFQQLALF